MAVTDVMEGNGQFNKYDIIHVWFMCPKIIWFMCPKIDCWFFFNVTKKFNQLWNYPYTFIFQRMSTTKVLESLFLYALKLTTCNYYF